MSTDERGADRLTPVRLCRNAEMSIAVIMMSEVTAMVEPVETSHYSIGEYLTEHNPDNQLTVACLKPSNVGMVNLSRRV